MSDNAGNENSSNPNSLIEILNQLNRKSKTKLDKKTEGIDFYLIKIDSENDMRIFIDSIRLLNICKPFVLCVVNTGNQQDNNFFVSFYYFTNNKNEEITEVKIPNCKNIKICKSNFDEFCENISKFINIEINDIISEKERAKLSVIRQYSIRNRHLEIADIDPEQWLNLCYSIARSKDNKNHKEIYSLATIAYIFGAKPQKTKENIFSTICLSNYIPIERFDNCINIIKSYMTSYNLSKLIKDKKISDFLRGRNNIIYLIPDTIKNSNKKHNIEIIGANYYISENDFSNVSVSDSECIILNNINSNTLDFKHINNVFIVKTNTNIAPFKIPNQNDLKKILFFSISEINLSDIKKIDIYDSGFREININASKNCQIEHFNLTNEKYTVDKIHINVENVIMKNFKIINRPKLKSTCVFS
ncbi:MAG: hypothetical protein P8N25_00580, partial [Alphaproteobacteria bacterium]|nr:hypothetical protein [Alphaproteobacteria bacterium]